MKTVRAATRWFPAVGVLVLGVLIFGLAVRGATTDKADGKANLKKPVAMHAGPGGGTIDKAGSAVDANVLRAAHGTLEVLPPLRADQLKDVSVVEQRGRALAVGPWPTGGLEKGRLPACTTDESCSDCIPCTQNVCTGGVCSNPPEDVGDTFAGCSDGYYCTGDELCDGAGNCSPGTPPCALACDEALNVCVETECALDTECDDSDECTEDTCVLDHGVNGLCSHRSICLNGRCCNNTTGACSAVTEKDCLAGGGAYLFTNGACTTIQPSGNMNDCPEYAAGIAPQGEYTGETEVISNLLCDNETRITDYRDEYQVKGYPGQPYIKIEFLRFVGRVISEYDVRWNITFYDENDLYVENVFWPDGQDDGWDIDYQIKTVDFDPPIVIPAKGKIGWSVQKNFSPGGRARLRFTDAVDVGTNWGINDKVAFEIVGSYASAPIGGCCLPSGSCQNKLPWVCEAGEGGIFQGAGTTCGLCVGGTGTPLFCDDDTDCVNGGTCKTQICDNSPTTPCTTDDQCPPGGTCINLSTACLTQACCEANSPVAACQEIVGAGKTCQTEIGPTWSGLGFGSRCEPNCCARSAVTGGNDCWSAAAQAMTIPAVAADPVSVTVTGNNGGATEDNYARCDTWEDSDPVEYGWWECIDVQEGLAGNDCFNIRVDLCCTDIDGQPLRPAWGNLVQGCDPCGDILQNAGVDPPLGVGRGTSGFARGEPFCNEDNIWMTFGPLPAGKYCYPVYTIADGTSGVPPGADYQLHFMIAACPTAACCTGDTCQVMDELDCAAANGYWLSPPYKEETTAACDNTPGTGTCAKGACCIGPGQCDDEIDVGQPMDETTCVNILQGEYLGGAKCADPVPPCPACEILTDANCSDHEDTWYLWQGYDPSDGTTWRRYDDFVAVGNASLATVCLVGAWIGGGADCACLDQSDEPDCPRWTNDQWTVSVYTNNNGLPGTLVGSSAVTNWAREVETIPATPGVTWDPYIVSLTLDTPIALTGGVTYFLSVFNDTSDWGENGPCWWYWSGSPDDGNSWHILDANGVFEPIDWYPYPDPPNGPFDLNWCVNFTWGVPAAITGACCQCGVACTPGQTWEQCDTLGGNWKMGEACTQTTCPNTAPANDACASATVVGQGTFNYNTICSTHAGPDRIDCDGNGSADTTVGRDVWFEYHSGACEGNLTVSMCDVQNYDAVLSLYTNGTNVCACPTDGTTLIACSDDGCDEAGGVGEITEWVLANQCVLIRVGGWAPDYDPEDPANTGPDVADMGFGHLDISCAAGCRVATTPAADTSVPDAGFGSRIRYLAFSAGTAGQREAIRVTFTDLPPPFEGQENRVMWVGSPVDVSEVAGLDNATPPTFKLSELQCDPYYADWTTYGTVYVRGEALVPRGVYTLQAIDEDDCSTANEADYSGPLALKLSRWGDAVGADNTASPEGSVKFTDISAAVDKFKNVPPAPSKSRVDVAPSKPNRIVDFGDIPAIVDAFRGLPYPYGGPAETPCP